MSGMQAPLIPDNLPEKGADVEQAPWIARAAVETWRMLKATERLGNEDGGPAIRVLMAAVRRQADVFCQAGLSWEEYDQQTYDVGMNVEVAYYETVHSAPKDKHVITETVRPGIKLDGKMIQPGLVVVTRSGRG